VAALLRVQVGALGVLDPAEHPQRLAPPVRRRRRHRGDAVALGAARSPPRLDERAVPVPVTQEHLRPMDQAFRAELHQLRLLVTPGRQGGRPLRRPIVGADLLAPVHHAAGHEPGEHPRLQPGREHPDEDLVEHGQRLVEPFQAQQRATLAVLGEGDEVDLTMAPADLLGGPRHLEGVAVAARREVGTGRGHEQQPALGAVGLAGVVEHARGPTEPTPRGRLCPLRRQCQADPYGAAGRSTGCAACRARGERPLVRLDAAGGVTAEERGLGQHREVLGVEPLGRVRGMKRLGGPPPCTGTMSPSARRPEVVHHDDMVAAPSRAR